MQWAEAALGDAIELEQLLMKRKPKTKPWWPENKDSVVVAYQRAHYEYDIYWQTGRPYGHIPASRMFRRCGRRAAWKLRSNRIGSSVTADLIAVAEALGMPAQSHIDRGSPGGFHAEGGTWWLPFFDGGLYVEFTMVEHQWTNRVSATQRVWIFGSHAFRYLMESLDISPPVRQVRDDSTVWTEAERMALIQRQ